MISKHGHNVVVWVDYFLKLPQNCAKYYQFLSYTFTLANRCCFICPLIVFYSNTELSLFGLVAFCLQISRNRNRLGSYLKIFRLGVLAAAAPDPAGPPVPLVKLGEPRGRAPRHRQEPPPHKVWPPRGHPLTARALARRHFFRASLSLPLPLLTPLTSGGFLTPHHHSVQPLRRAGGHWRCQLSP